MRKPLLWLVLLTALVTTMGQVGASATAPRATAAATTVCAVHCDTLDPSQAAQETFPVPNVTDNGRLIELHVDDADGMAWASIDSGQTGDSVWLDRSWDGGTTWDGLLGQAAIPSTWTGTRTLMYNLYDPTEPPPRRAARVRRRGRACPAPTGRT